MHSERSAVSSFPLFLAVRTLVVGEERRSRERVRTLLERAEEIEVVREFESVIEALDSADAEAADLLFLDVKLPELTGLTLLETLGERCPQIIFVTPASAEDLQRAIAAHGLYSLPKPFTDEEFYDTLRRGCLRVLQERLGLPTATHDRISALLAKLGGEAPSHADQLVVPEKGSKIYHLIRLHEIDWIEAENGGVRVHVGEEAFWLRTTLADVERRLDPAMFLRVHRSRIVNRTRITAFRYLWKGEYSVILANGNSVGTGRTYRSVIEGFLGTPALRGKGSRRRSRELIKTDVTHATTQPPRRGRSPGGELRAVPAPPRGINIRDLRSSAIVPLPFFPPPLEPDRDRPRSQVAPGNHSSGKGGRSRWRRGLIIGRV